MWVSFWRVDGSEEVKWDRRREQHVGLALVSDGCHLSAQGD